MVCPRVGLDGHMLGSGRNGLAEVHAGKTTPGDVVIAGRSTTKVLDFAPVAYVHRDRQATELLPRPDPALARQAERLSRRQTCRQVHAVAVIGYGARAPRYDALHGARGLALGTEGSAGKPSYPSDVDSLGMAISMLLALHWVSRPGH